MNYKIDTFSELIEHIAANWRIAGNPVIIDTTESRLTKKLIEISFDRTSKIPTLKEVMHLANLLGIHPKDIEDVKFYQGYLGYDPNPEDYYGSVTFVLKD